MGAKGARRSMGTKGTKVKFCPFCTPTLPEGGIKYGGEFLFNKFCAKFLCAICSVFLRICTATH